MLLLIGISLSGLLVHQIPPLFVGVLFPLPTHHPFLYFLISFHFHLFFPFITDVEQIQRIINEVFFYVPIQRCICCEAGGVVYFKQVWVKFVVDHDVKAQNFEAHVVGEVVRVNREEGT